MGGLFKISPMRKSRLLVNKTPIFVINIDHLVSKIVMAKVIADFCWEHDKKFDPNMKRSTFMKLVKQQLRFQGMMGMNTDNWESASEEFVQAYNDAYNAIEEYIDKNYPYLNGN